uniref:Uncharacterized protein n=2 Tax=Brassica oleracea var. oleracea TaxID=109376 RepID=A0A0D3BT22_BRAOL
MSFAGGRDGSKGFMKRVTSTFSTKKNKNTTNDPKPLLPRSRSTGSNYESMRLLHGQGKRALPHVNTKRTKSAGVSPQPRRQKIDESGKQFTKLRCFDDSDSVWLSSDCASSSSLLGERRVSVSFHFSLDERVVSWLSNAAKNQGDIITTAENHQKSSKKAKYSSEKNNNKTCPSEESYASPELTLQEEKKVSFSLESEMSLEKSAEIGDPKSKTVAEPLFWPYEQKFDWTPDDILKHFSISPRRKKSTGNKSNGTSPRSMRAQLQTRKLVLKEGCKRKLMFNGPGSSPKQARTIGNKKTKMSKNQQQPIMKSLKRNNSLPASLKRNSREEVPVQAAEESVEMCRKTPKKLIMTRRSRTFIEDDFALMNDFSIENAVGLCEFRGREGIDSDFNTDVKSETYNMSFAGGRDGSKGLIKRITSTFSINKNQNTTTNDPKPVFPRSRSTGASYESMKLRQGKKALPDVTAKKTKRTKSACVSPQRRREKIDESRKQQIEDIDSIWLTSDSSSSLLGERKVSVSFHFSLDESIVSWLSNAAKNQEDTKDNHHHHHQKSSKDAKYSSENIRKDGKYVGTDSAKPCSSHLPENNNKTCEETSSFNRYVSRELTSQSHEEKKVTFSLESDASPSPVISNLWPPTPPITILASALEKVAEIGGSKRRNVVEPLFWPLEQKFDWTTDDIMKHFSMSPQRKKYIGSKSASTSPRSMRAQLHTRKLDLKEGCKRKLMFNGRPGSNSKLTQIPELKQTISSDQPPIKNRLKRNKSLPSRLRNTSEISSKVVPIEATEESVEISREEKKTPKKLVMTRKSRTFLEDDFGLMNDFSIENAVGLCEFRGREGIDSDFNTDCFLFEDSL